MSRWGWVGIAALGLTAGGAAAPTAGAQVFSRVSFEQPTPPIAASTAPPAEMLIAPVDTPPTIDGRLDDACWQRAEPFSPFVVYRSPTPALENREVRMAFDEQNLYVAVKLHKQPGYTLQVRTPIDDNSHMWEDDEFELFLDPGLSRREYVQIIVNASGNRFDARYRKRWVQDPAAAEPGQLIEVREDDVAWSSGIEAVVDAGRPEDAFWTIEMRLPVKPMGLDAIPLGSRWGVNLTSNNPRTGQLSNWIVGDWHDPRTYGHVLMGQPRLAVTNTSFGALHPGDNMFRATFGNVDTQPRRYRLTLGGAADDRAIEGGELRFELQPGELRTFARSYRIGPGSSPAFVVAQVHDDEGRLLFHARRSAVRAEPFQLRIAPYGYLRAVSAARGRLEVRVGDLTLGQTRIQATLKRDGRPLAQQTLPVEQPAAEFAIDTTSLPVGHYRLDAVLLDDQGAALAQQSADFAISDSPFPQNFALVEDATRP